MKLREEKSVEEDPVTQENGHGDQSDRLVKKIIYLFEK